MEPWKTFDKSATPRISNQGTTFPTVLQGTHTTSQMLMAGQDLVDTSRSFLGRPAEPTMPTGDPEFLDVLSNAMYHEQMLDRQPGPTNFSPQEMHKHTVPGTIQAVPALNNMRPVPLHGHAAIHYTNRNVPLERPTSGSVPSASTTTKAMKPPPPRGQVVTRPFELDASLKSPATKTGPAVTTPERRMFMTAEIHRARRAEMKAQKAKESGRAVSRKRSASNVPSQPSGPAQSAARTSKKRRPNHPPGTSVPIQAYSQTRTPVATPSPQVQQTHLNQHQRLMVPIQRQGQVAAPIGTPVLQLTHANRPDVRIHNQGQLGTLVAIPSAPVQQPYPGQAPWPNVPIQGQGQARIQIAAQALEVQQPYPVTYPLHSTHGYPMSREVDVVQPSWLHSPNAHDHALSRRREEDEVPSPFTKLGQATGGGGNTFMGLPSAMEASNGDPWQI